MRHQKPKNSLLKIILNYFPIILFIGIIIFFSLKNNNEIGELKQKGKKTKALIYDKKSVGSKGTIRSFYRFKVNENYYEGFDDNENLVKFDSIVIIYAENNPELNRSKEFVDNY